jgi:hypothetical protein
MTIMEYPKTRPKNPMEDYDPTNRDFQRTEDEVDNISGSEKEALDEKRKDKKKKQPEASAKQNNKEKIS